MYEKLVEFFSALIYNTVEANSKFSKHKYTFVNIKTYRKEVIIK